MQGIVGEVVKGEFWCVGQFDDDCVGFFQILYYGCIGWGDQVFVGWYIVEIWLVFEIDIFFDGDGYIMQWV